MKELLKKADEKGFAVPAFNIGSEAILKGVSYRIKFKSRNKELPFQIKEYYKMLKNE